MTGTPLYRPLVTLEPTPALVVSALNPPPLALGVLVGALSYVLFGTSPEQANRRAGRSGIRWAACRPKVARLPRDAHPHGVGVPTRAATFPGTGLPRAGGRRNLTFVLSEVR